MTAPIANIARAIFSRNRKTIGELAASLEVELPLDDASASASMSTLHLDFTFPGPLVTALSIAYSWNALHDGLINTAGDLTACFMRSWTVTFARGADEMQRTLNEHYGAPRALPSHHVYAEMYLFATRGDEHRLTYYAELPDWASPPVDPAVRERTLRAIAESARTAPDVAPLVQLVGSLPKGCGIRPRTAACDDQVEIDVVPPAPGTDVVRWFGLDCLTPLEVCFPPEPAPGEQVFMGTFSGAPTRTRYLRTPTGEDPTLGRFRVAITLENDHDTVRRIHFGRR